MFITHIIRSTLSFIILVNRCFLNWSCVQRWQHLGIVICFNIISNRRLDIVPPIRWIRAMNMFSNVKVQAIIDLHINVAEDSGSWNTQVSLYKYLYKVPHTDTISHRSPFHVSDTFFYIFPPCAYPFEWNLRVWCPSPPPHPGVQAVMKT